MTKTKVQPGDLIVEMISENVSLRRIDSQLYIFSGNYWTSVTTDEVFTYIREKMSKEEAIHVSTAVLKEAVLRIRQLEYFEMPVEAIAPDSWINFENGWLDLVDGTFHNHSENCTKYFLHMNHFSYIESANHKEAPCFERFCETSLDGSHEKRTLLLQILGCCISEVQNVKAAFFLLGASNSGKSVILELLQKVVGINCTTTIQLNKLGQRFNRAKLATSRLNICTELNGEKLRDVDFFKVVTSHERITAENKGETPFDFRVKTKLITAGNIMPTLPETIGAEAILNRMVILKFNKSIEESERDINLLEKLEAEKDIIFSLAVDELVQLVASDYKFTKPEDSLGFLDAMEAPVKSVEEFVQECCLLKTDGREHLVTLWEAFENFCDRNGYEVRMTKVQFSQKLLSFPGVKRSKFRLGGKPLAGFLGIELKRVILWQDSEE